MQWRRSLECGKLFPAIAERTSFIVLKYVNKNPSLASCTACQRKFFTPNTYYNDPGGAEQYLRDKFDLHSCSDAFKTVRKTAWGTSW
jgi:hypothetical protein